MLRARRAPRRCWRWCSSFASCPWEESCWSLTCRDGHANMASAEYHNVVINSITSVVSKSRGKLKTPAPHYRPADSLASPRFSGVRTFMRLPHVTTTEDVDVAFVGLPFDTGASFKVGARFGPEAVRSASVLLRPFHPDLDLDIFNHVSAVDFGDAPVAPGFIEDSNDRIVNFLRSLHAADVAPISLGGDHSVALPELRAAAEKHGPLALVLFDSHTDTWESYFGHRYFHGTPFKRALEEGLLDPHHSIMIGIRGPLYDANDLGNAR